jgi:hypothetical protein
MKEAESRRDLDRGAPSDLWRNTLSQIPTIFGRLVYLASLRVTNTGVYEHHGLSLLFGDTEADAALRRSHQEAFAAWLNCSLEQQKSDVDRYLADLDSNQRVVVETWLRLSPYRGLVPASVKTFERDLFISDFEMLLEILRTEYGVSAPDQDA